MLKHVRQSIHQFDRRLWNNRRTAYLRRAYIRFCNVNLMEASASASYYLLLAVFPTLIFLVSIYSYLNHGQMQDYLQRLSLEGFMPAEVKRVLDSLLAEIQAGSRSYSVLSLSALTLVWAAAKGVGALLQSLNRIYEQKLLKNAYLRRIIAFLTIFILVFVLALFLFLSSLWDRITFWLRSQLSLSEGNPISDLLRQQLKHRYLITFLIITCLFSLIYWFVSGRIGRFRDAVYGGIFSALSWVIFPFLFSLYVNTNRNLNVLYGSITGFVVLLLWIYFSCAMILIGAFVHTESIRRSLTRNLVEIEADAFADLSFSKRLKIRLRPEAALLNIQEKRLELGKEIARLEKELPEISPGEANYEANWD
ncbi:MAG: YihY/virulence factor BrkB family protein [Eubacteriales bacterium]|nr:YihY/virulence factor BrkB family protein [Eubacteriales bacterium]